MLLYARGAEAAVGSRMLVLRLTALALALALRPVLLGLTDLRRMALRLPMLRRTLALTDLGIITRSEGVLCTRDSARTTGLAIC